MPTLGQFSFAKGELSPSIYGRVDTTAYGIGLRRARNAIIHASGGVSNRPGLAFVGYCKDHNYTARLLNFQFKTTDVYVLEFGDFYMRVIRNGGHVLETAKVISNVVYTDVVTVTSNSHGFVNNDEVLIDSLVGPTRLNGRRFRVASVTTNTFILVDQVTGTGISPVLPPYASGGTAERVYEIVTPYAFEDLPELKYVQSADVMTLTHRSYPVQELSRTGHASWTIAEPSFEPSITFPLGQAVTVTSAGAVTDRYRVTAIADETAEESLPGLSTATKTITAATKANPCVVTAVAHGYSNGDEIYISGILGMTQLNDRRFTIQNKTVDTFELQDENSTAYTTYSSAGITRTTFVRITNSAVTRNNTIAWTAVTGASKYTIYREKSGIFGLIGESQTTAFTDDNIAPETSSGPPQARNPFFGVGNYPGVSSYFEQRRVFGGTTNKPDTSYFTQIGNQSNMSVSSPVQDDDAITATLASRQVNEIRGYVPGNDLLVLTSGSEWRVNSGPDTAFSPTSIRQKPQSTWGCAHRAPILIGNTVLYVDGSETIVRSLGYSLQIDGYTGTDMTILSSHLFRLKTIDDWCYARAPDPVTHIVRSDGQVCAFTFQQEQEVTAWTTWDTLGAFEACTVIPNGADDDTYFVVQRTINGNVVRYIERTHTRRFVDVRDCFFVDAGVSVDDPATITNVTLTNPVLVRAPGHGLINGDEVDIYDITWVPDFDSLDNETQPDQLNTHRYTISNSSADEFEIAAIDATGFNSYVTGGTVRKTVGSVSGLDHLEGSAVSVLSDGNVISNLTVADGEITLPQNASRVHVGLKYICDIETLDLEAPQGTVQGKKKKIPEATFRFERSRGFLTGPTFLKLKVVKQREFELMGNPTDLLTGDKRVTFTPDWNKEGRICIRQPYPLPMTLLAIIPEVTL